ncbi:hypothetical protein ILUMI_00678, partial [Ignelater luminosus]
ITSVKTIMEQTEFEIEITTDKVALFVWLETKPHIRSRFSENGFLQVTEKKIVRVTTESKPSLEDFVNALEMSVLYYATDSNENNNSQKIYTLKVESTPRLLGQHDSTLEVREMIISMWEAKVSKHEILKRVDLSEKDKGDADGVYSLRTRVPGGIYSDLKQNKIIGDVFYRFNDTETRWVSKKDWTYSIKFTAEIGLVELPNINLVFDGVDTFSEIYLNSHKLGITDNMFVRYIFDVKSLLKNGENHLEVRFKSAVNKAQQLFDTQAKRYPVVPLCVPEEYNGECHANHVRKMQASFSWDWGPALPSMGIWKDVYLQGYIVAVIQDATVKIYPDKNEKEWAVETKVYFSGNSKGDPVTGDISLYLDNDDISKYCPFRRQTIKKNQHGEFVGTFTCNIAKDKVQLWWPNGYGEAKLYPLNIFYSSDNPGIADRDSLILRIGYRTVQLIQDEIYSGRKFYFQVNGVPIFAKGTNSIPINILPELGQNETTIRFLLQSAKDTHMNMIRVWGGGTYEADTFYNIADEMGIMIWQDFMFACAMYPTDDNFLNSVKSEVRHQVRRLQYHPSIVVWAGNNENEAALRQNWYGTKDNLELYHTDYKILYVETIRKELLLSDDSRPYLTSSPTNGIQSDEKEDYLAKNPQSHFYGDVHFYNYDNNSWDSRYYPLTRFASEYGYQSLPRYWTLLTATKLEEDLKMNSSFLNSRQHLPKGYERMIRLIKHQLFLPDQTSKDDLKTLIYYSQIIQAMAVKKQTEFYRQWRNSLNSEGKGFTMGALYWQLNDVWVAPTWSGIDFEGNWKMQHYYAKNFFAPVIVTGDLRSDGFLDLYVVSDLQDEISDVFLNILVYKWESINPVHNETFKINV